MVIQSLLFLEVVAVLSLGASRATPTVGSAYEWTFGTTRRAPNVLTRDGFVIVGKINKVMADGGASGECFVTSVLAEINGREDQGFVARKLPAPCSFELSPGGQLAKLSAFGQTIGDSSELDFARKSVLAAHGLEVGGSKRTVDELPDGGTLELFVQRLPNDHRGARRIHASARIQRFARNGKDVIDGSGSATGAYLEADPVVGQGRVRLATQTKGRSDMMPVFHFSFAESKRVDEETWRLAATRREPRFPTDLDAEVDPMWACGDATVEARKRASAELAFDPLIRDTPGLPVSENCRDVNEPGIVLYLDNERLATMDWMSTAKKILDISPPVDRERLLELVTSSPRRPDFPVPLPVYLHVPAGTDEEVIATTLRMFGKDFEVRLLFQRTGSPEPGGSLAAKASLKRLMEFNRSRQWAMKVLSLQLEEGCPLPNDDGFSDWDPPDNGAVELISLYTGVCGCGNTLSLDAMLNLAKQIVGPQARYTCWKPPNDNIRSLEEPGSH